MNRFLRIVGAPIIGLGLLTGVTSCDEEGKRFNNPKETIPQIYLEAADVYEGRANQAEKAATTLLQKGTSKDSLRAERQQTLARLWEGIAVSCKARYERHTKGDYTPIGLGLDLDPNDSTVLVVNPYRHNFPEAKQLRKLGEDVTATIKNPEAENQ